MCIRDRWKRTQEILGTALVPDVKKLVIEITKLLKAFNNLDPETQKFLARLSVIGTAVAFVTAGLFGLGAAIIGLKATFGGLALAGAGVTAAFAGLGPIGLAIAGITVAIGGTIIAANQLEDSNAAAFDERPVVNFAYEVDDVSKALANLGQEVEQYNKVSGAAFDERPVVNFAYEVDDVSKALKNQGQVVSSYGTQATGALNEAEEAAKGLGEEVDKTTEKFELTRKSIAKLRLEVSKLQGDGTPISQNRPSLAFNRLNPITGLIPSGTTQDGTKTRGLGYVGNFVADNANREAREKIEEDNEKRREKQAEKDARQEKRNFDRSLRYASRYYADRDRRVAESEQLKRDEAKESARYRKQLDQEELDRNVQYASLIISMRKRIDREERSLRKQTDRERDAENNKRVRQAEQIIRQHERDGIRQINVLQLLGEEYDELNARLRATQRTGKAAFETIGNRINRLEGEVGSAIDALERLQDVFDKLSGDEDDEEGGGRLSSLFSGLKSYFGFSLNAARAIAGGYSGDYASVVTGSANALGSLPGIYSGFGGAIKGVDNTKTGAKQTENRSFFYDQFNPPPGGFATPPSDDADDEDAPGAPPITIINRIVVNDKVVQEIEQTAQRLRSTNRIPKGPNL